MRPVSITPKGSTSSDERGLIMPSYTSLRWRPASIVMIEIHVVPRVPVEELDEGDLDLQGSCKVDGVYVVTLAPWLGERGNIRSQALELLHAHVEIADPDQFRFLVAIIKDQPRMVRKRIGSWHMTSLEPSTHTLLNGVEPVSTADFDAELPA